MAQSPATPWDARLSSYCQAQYRAFVGGFSMAYGAALLGQRPAMNCQTGIVDSQREKCADQTRTTLTNLQRPTPGCCGHRQLACQTQPKDASSRRPSRRPEANLSKMLCCQHLQRHSRMGRPSKLAPPPARNRRATTPPTQPQRSKRSRNSRHSGAKSHNRKSHSKRHLSADPACLTVKCSAPSKALAASATSCAEVLPQPCRPCRAGGAGLSNCFSRREVARPKKQSLCQADFRHPQTLRRNGPSV